MKVLPALLLPLAGPLLAQQPTTQPHSQPQQPVTSAPAAVATEPKPHKELGFEDVFALPGRMAKPYDKFRGWLDAQHFLVFGEVAQADKTVRGFCKVNAQSGERALVFDHPRMIEALTKLPGFSRRDAEAIGNDPEVFQWTRDRSGVLLNTAHDLVWYDVTKGAAIRLTNTPDPEVGEQASPDGRLVAFVGDDHNLHVVGTDGSAPRALTRGGSKDLLFGRLDWVYQEELYGRGNFQGSWWAPDSSMIALLRLDESAVREFTLASDVPIQPLIESEKYPKAGAPNPIAALGVVDVRGGEVRWFDLSRYGRTETLIVRVQWHPDTSEVYFQVQDREQRWLELLAGNPRTGQVRVVLREESDCWVEAGGEPVWLDGGKTFLWLSERDGWKHVYHYQRDGKQLARVTEGPFEVDEICGVDEQARLVYFLSDKTDIKEVHLFRVGLDGKGLAPVTKEPGTHKVELSPDKAHFIDTFTSVAQLQKVDVKRVDDQVVRNLGDSDMTPLAEFGISPAEFVKVPTRDGQELEALLLKPKGWQAGKPVPTVLHTYSGPHAPQVRNAWGRRHYLWHQYLAQKGYLVVVCDNRSASGKGRKATSACYRNLGETECRDLEDCVDWLVKQGLADPKRVALWGWSYGGYQTSYCLTHSTRWAVGMAVNPVTDWQLYDSIYTERYMAAPANNPEGYRKSSVTGAAANLFGKLLLLTSTMDDNVHQQNTLQFARALQNAGKTFSMMLYPGVRHGIENPRQLRHVYLTMTEFLDKNL